jgi:centrosomal protein CEP104
VLREDFDEAKRLKSAIDRLKAISAHLGQLEERKRLAIMGEDYDAAKLIKTEIDKLKESAIKGSSDEGGVQLPKIGGSMSNRVQHPNKSQFEERKGDS